MTKLDKLDKENVKRAVNAHINKEQMFTPELKNKIRQQAFEKESRSTKLNRKRILAPLLSSILGISVACILIFTLIGNPFGKQEIDSRSNTQTAGVTGVKEADVKAFIMEYKSITHNVKVGEKDNAMALTEVKPYLNDEWYKVNERDKRVNFPFNYAHTSQNDIVLNDVQIKSLEKNDKGEGYKVKYTLLLSIGEHEGVEKNGDMIIIEGGDKGFTITYDWETMIIFDKFHFR